MYYWASIRRPRIGRGSQILGKWWRKKSNKEAGLKVSETEYL